MELTIIETLRFLDLKKRCEDYLEAIKADDWHEDRHSNYEQAILEVALTLGLGTDAWDKINKAIAEFESRTS